MAILFSLLLQWSAFGDEGWLTLAPGLDAGYFKVERYTDSGDSVVTVLRVDPSLYSLEVLDAKSLAGESHSARGWAETHDAIATINAGMFTTDGVTHVGFMRVNGAVVSRGRNGYQSVLAIGTPPASDQPTFRIFDVDADPPDTSYRSFPTMVQNLRLIKRPAENRWNITSEKTWSEAALAEDSLGRALLIFCKSPYSMPEFNQIILGLPLGIVAAQHLEGGSEAQMYVKYGDFEIDLVGSYDPGFGEENFDAFRTSIPNVIAVRKRTP